MAAGPEAPETAVERKRGRKRKKEAKDKNVENDVQPKAKKKRNQVECELGDPRWDENPGVSAEAGEGHVGPSLISLCLEWFHILIPKPDLSAKRDSHDWFRKAYSSEEGQSLTQ